MVGKGWLGGDVAHQEVLAQKDRFAMYVQSLGHPPEQPVNLLPQHANNHEKIMKNTENILLAELHCIQNHETTARKIKIQIDGKQNQSIVLS